MDLYLQIKMNLINYWNLIFKTLMYTELRKFISKIGVATYKIVYKRFSTLHSYGIDDVDEIMNMDLTLIHREKK